MVPGLPVVQGSKVQAVVAPGDPDPGRKIDLGFQVPGEVFGALTIVGLLIGTYIYGVWQTRAADS